MQVRAVIFDFNGTLFNDTEFHNQAWQQFANNRGRQLSPEELKNNIHGFTNREIFKFILNKEILPSEDSTLYEEKESIYRGICAKNPDKCVLTPGAIEFFERLSDQNIPRTIATASYLKNVEMYFSLFNLSLWFNFEKVVYDNGKYRGKPFPDIFLAAADKLRIPIDQCLIIEDSIAGVQAAKNAGAGKVIAFSDETQGDKFSRFDFIDQIISDFRQIKVQFDM